MKNKNYTNLTKQESHKKNLNSLFLCNYNGIDLYKISGYFRGGENKWQTKKE